MRLFLAGVGRIAREERFENHTMPPGHARTEAEGRAGHENYYSKMGILYGRATYS